MSQFEPIWDYRNPYEWMNRVSASEMPPVIFSVAITGGMQGKEYNINLPETVEEQVEATYAAYMEGASIVHIHARKPENPAEQTVDKYIYSQINAQIRKRCPRMIINNSTGGSPSLSLEEKLGALYSDNPPDMASLNPGPFMINMKRKERKEPLKAPHPAFEEDFCIPTTYGAIRDTAKILLDLGIKPEIEVFQPGHLCVVNDLIKRKLITPPYDLQLVFGFQTSTYPTPWNVLSTVQDLPAQTVFFTAGIGAYQLPINVLGMILGGHVRIGLEDNIYYRKGELAISSAQLVARTRRIAEDMNRSIATPKQAREMLGLKDCQ